MAAVIRQSEGWAKTLVPSIFNDGGTDSANRTQPRFQLRSETQHRGRFVRDERWQGRTRR